MIEPRSRPVPQDSRGDRDLTSHVAEMYYATRGSGEIPCPSHVPSNAESRERYLSSGFRNRNVRPATNPPARSATRWIQTEGM